MPRLRLLLLLPVSPLPVFSGGRLRMLEVMKRLALRHEVTAISFWRSAEERAGLQTLAAQWPLQVIGVPYTGPEGSAALSVLAARAQAAGRGWPGAVASWQQPAMYRAIDQVIARQRIDLIQVEFTFLSQYALPYPRIPRLLITHDIFSVSFGRRAQLAAAWRQRWRLQRQARQWRRYERAIYPTFAAVAMMSEQDAALARQIAPAANLVILPNGVDTTALLPGKIRGNPQRLLFIGSPTHPPNLDAARWLLTAIWPDLQRRHPHLTLTLVNLDHPDVHACAGSGVEITGRLPDLTPIYHQADIALAPLRAGSGTRLKILEAFAFGVPVVSTSIGCEGIAATPDQHLLVADSAAEFAAAIERLLADEPLRCHLAGQARTLATTRYDWEEIVRQHEAVYHTLLTPTPSP